MRLMKSANFLGRSVPCSVLPRTRLGGLRHCSLDGTPGQLDETVNADSRKCVERARSRRLGKNALFLLLSALALAALALLAPRTRLLALELAARNASAPHLLQHCRRLCESRLLRLLPRERLRLLSLLGELRFS